jgi:hypothetical protein
MKELELLHRLVYLDRDYISDVYEVITGTPAKTQITKTQAKKAGAGIPVFSAEISAGETRAFSVSSTSMLKTLMPKLESLSDVSPREVQSGGKSKIGWIEGEMSVFMINLKRKDTGEVHERVIASEKYFAIRCGDGQKCALLTTPEYFTSGVASFLTLYETVLGSHGIRVRALVRSYPANSDFQENIAVPLVIIEAADS